jgi:hypothetical protein
VKIQGNLTVTGKGEKITVQEIDGNPTVENVNAIKFSNGSVTDNGDGTVTVVTIGGNSASDPGFYGIYVRESDGNPPTYRNDTITFDSQYFYLHSNSVSKPTVSMRDNFQKRFVQSFPIGAQEWQVNHNLGATDIIFNVWDNRQISIIPDKADASNPNTAFFYFTTFRTGKACILGI